MGYRLAACALGVGALIVLDVVLGLVGWTPKEDAASLRAFSEKAHFLPLIDDGDGFLEIRDGWVNDGETLEIQPGARAGEFVLLPGFRPVRIPVEKDPSVYRVVALGGSTTYGLGVGADQAFAAVLGRAIEPSLEAGTRVEVVNLGCAGWGSDRVARLYSELGTLEPDLVVVYSGHNELLRWHASEGSTAVAEGLSASLLRRSTIARWLQRWIGFGASSKKKGSEHSLADQVAQVTVYDPVEAPAGEQRRPGRDLITAAARDYARNLESVADRAQDTGVRTLFVLPVPNLMYPPAISVHEGSVDEKQHHALELEIQSAYARQDATVAIRAVDRAIELSPGFAMNHYWKGLIELGQGREAAAKQSLQRALDLDVRTHRITSPFEEAFVGVMEARVLEWVDLRETFRSSAALRQPQDLFWDWVHPTRQGHELIGRELAEQWADDR